MSIPKLSLPVTKLNAIAVVVVLALLFAGRWLWAFWMILGWSLRDDGEVYQQIRAMVARKMEREDRDVR